MIPGEYFLEDGDIEINAGRPVCRLAVTNRGDRPIQVGSHCHFFEVNRSLAFNRELATYGEEAKFGGGKVIRDGMGQSPTATRAAGSPDLVITSVIVIDSSGIYKADVGVRDGRISAIGKAGNSAAMDGVSPGLEI